MVTVSCCSKIGLYKLTVKKTSEKKHKASQYLSYILLYKSCEGIVSNTYSNETAAFFSEAKGFSCIPLGKGSSPFLIAKLC